MTAQLRLAGWWRLLQAALAVAVVTLLGAGTASALTVPVLETRVGASTPAAQVAIGVHESISAGQRWGSAPPDADSVVATGVAANTGGRLFWSGGDMAKGAAEFAENSGGKTLEMTRMGRSLCGLPKRRRTT